jgi:hypothetical protein
MKQLLKEAGRWSRRIPRKRPNDNSYHEKSYEALYILSEST